MKRIQFIYIAVLTIFLINGSLLAQDTTMTITQFGNVGIGTVNPSSKLQVNGSLGVGEFFRFSNHMFSSRVAENNINVDVAVFGANYGISGFEAGVYGLTYSPEGYGVYSDGNFGVNGNATINGNVSTNGVNTGAETVKIVRGVIAADGTILSGSGFTVERSEAGVYKITFTESFSDYPSATGSVLNFGYMQMIEIAYGTSVTVGLRNGSTDEYFDSIFTFMAMGGAGNKTTKTTPVLSADK